MVGDGESGGAPPHVCMSEKVRGCINASCKGGGRMRHRRMEARREGGVMEAVKTKVGIGNFLWDHNLALA